MRPVQPLDKAAVAQLTSELMVAVRDHYLRRPKARTSALEVLNAAGIVVAIILAAARECGDEGDARAFFDRAVEQELETVETLPTTLGELTRRRTP